MHLLQGKGMQDEVNMKEKELNQLRQEKKQMQMKLEKEKQQAARSNQVSKASPWILNQ